MAENGGIGEKRHFKPERRASRADPCFRQGTKASFIRLAVLLVVILRWRPASSNRATLFPPTLCYRDVAPRDVSAPRSKRPRYRTFFARRSNIVERLDIVKRQRGKKLKLVRGCTSVEWREEGRENRGGVGIATIQHQFPFASPSFPESRENTLANCGPLRIARDCERRVGSYKASFFFFLEIMIDCANMEKYSWLTG